MDCCKSKRYAENNQSVSLLLFLDHCTKPGDFKDFFYRRIHLCDGNFSFPSIFHIYLIYGGGYRSRTCYPLRELVFETNALPSRPSSLVHPDRIELSSRAPQAPTLSVKLRVRSDCSLTDKAH